MADEERGLSLVQRVTGMVRTKKTLGGIRSRTEKLREELEQAESVEELVSGLFALIDEMLDEVDKSGQAIQRANTLMRNRIKARKETLGKFFSEQL